MNRQARSPISDDRDPPALILQAAANGVVEHGYDAVRLRDIAQEAGFSIGLVQHYFGSREELLNRALSHSSDALVEAWASVVADETDPWRRIVALIDQLAEDPELRQHCVRWTELCVVAARRPQLAAEVQRVYDVWREILAQAIMAGVESGQFKLKLPFADVLDLLLSHIDGFELQIAAGIVDVDGPRVRTVALRTAQLALGLEAEDT